MTSQAFQTQARAIDHLGRGQIADCPTAVSELWKNAYDAYARSATLHIFDGMPCVAAVFDNGHGMSAEDFKTKWMTIGTESKLEGEEPSIEQRNGLPVRPRQGEKGIGRLSAAFLGPVTVVVSKRGKEFVAGLVDWRLFENPFLTLSDVTIPVEAFYDPREIDSLLVGMISESASNLKGGKSRRSSVTDAWTRFTNLETSKGLVPTANKILGFSSAASNLSKRVIETVLPEWDVWSGQSENGTALIILDAGAELSVWVERDRDDDEFDAARRMLLATLTGFVDPYSTTRADDFAYEVVVHKSGITSTIVSSDVVFGLEELQSLEHHVIGMIDENGVFHGSVRAFGVDQGAWTTPLRQKPAAKASLGAGRFDICIGTFELDLDRSTHPATVHAQLDEMATRYAGLAIYRDGLRVMPYGRPEADFFGIEERRSKHAGREFWSYRRTFGRVAFTRENNPNLRDKAGREGLIDNTARRELKALVVELLQTSARRFFNADSNVSKELLPSVRERNRLAKDAEKKAGERYRNEFRAKVRDLQANLPIVESRVATLRTDLDNLVGIAQPTRLATFGAELDRLRAEVDMLAAPPRPKSLGRFEQEYRAYRDSYTALRQDADQLVEDWTHAIETAADEPAELLADMSKRHRASLKRLLSGLREEVENAWNQSALPKLQGDVISDADRYLVEAQPIVASVQAEAMSTVQGIKALDELRGRLHHEFSDRYGELARSIRQLADGVELGAAIIWSSELRNDLEIQISQLTSLAQLGVTVEIVGHEFETVDKRIRDQLRRLPRACREGQSLGNLRATIDELIGRLRFLGPLRVSGSRLKEDITGESIGLDIEKFFGTEFLTRRIAFEISDGFNQIKIRDYRSRIVPVFLNLINNAVYWVTKTDRRRQIRLSAIDGCAVISDSGPGIDVDDEPSLFRLFFSRRIGGRGVGLYLCRQNLAAGGHSIDLARPGDRAHVLPGANFVIRYQGVS